MYAIIEDGGKQYKVQPGEKVCVELRELQEGQTELEFDQVVYLRDEDTVLVGRPLIEGARVIGKINATLPGPKLYPTHFRRRKDSQRRIGHRQKYLEVEITGINKP